jgi:hypothetical protein
MNASTDTEVCAHHSTPAIIEIQAQEQMSCVSLDVFTLTSDLDRIRQTFSQTTGKP